jgi:hypothetical protein
MNGAHTLYAVAHDAAGNRATTTKSITVANTYAAPTASPGAGTYTATQNVVLSAAEARQIHYSLSSDPSCSSGTTYTGAVPISVTSTLKAVACYLSGTSSVATFGYVIQNVDTTLPSVAFSAPAANASVTGSVVMTASASDNVGVVGVQFKVDGATVGAEDTSAPYTTVWNAAAATNGLHTLSATARDAAGNTKTVTENVTVTNVVNTPNTLYLSPSGSDTNDGLTAATALKTLTGVQAKLLKLKPQTDVVVHIALGTYVNAGSSNWTYAIPGHSITFLGDGSGASSIPVFTSCTSSSGSSCSGGTWFDLKLDNGFATNLIFDHIKVTHYQGAIFFHSNRDDTARWNGGNIIRNSVFDTLGNSYNSSLGASYEAILIQNSRDNRIENNTFTGMHGGVLYHAIYIASYGNNNVITGNSFSHGEGDPIRLRDASNNNTISNNSFNDIGHDAMVTEWFCQGSLCTKPVPECPSTGNVATNNTFTDSYGCAGFIPAVFTYNLYAVSACGVSVAQQNLTQSGTVQNANACTR